MRSAAVTVCAKIKERLFLGVAADWINEPKTKEVEYCWSPASMEILIDTDIGRTG